MSFAGLWKFLWKLSPRKEERTRNCGREAHRQLLQKLLKHMIYNDLTRDWRDVALGVAVMIITDFRQLICTGLVHTIP